MTSNAKLSTSDRFEIFEQLHQHQRCIDHDGSRLSAEQYISLYWEDASFTVKDLREQTFKGPEGLKQLYDYAHSVFPLHKWRHSLGTFAIDGAGDDATAQWNWIVTWKAEQQGVVSTGTYSDKFQKRNGVWKCLERFSDIDPNWPAKLFAPWVAEQEKTFKAS